MREAFFKKLFSHAQLDSNVLLLTADLGFGVFDSFAKSLPNQFLNVGVAEQNMTGIAAGLSLEGKTVFTYSIGNFCTLRCLEQIRNDILYHNLPVNIISVGSGLSYGSLGMSHHATEDIGVLRSLPGLRIFSPADVHEVESIFSLLISDPAPSYIRLDKSKLHPPSNCSFHPFKLRPVVHGSNIALISTAGMVSEAVNVSRLLSNSNHSSSVYSAHTLKPFDFQSLASISETHEYIFTIEEHCYYGGLGSIVAEALLDLRILPKVFHRFSLPDSFSTIVGSQSYLRSAYKIDSQSVYAKLIEYLS